MITLNHYLIVASIIFTIGLIGVVKRQNLIMVFFSTEIMLNAVNIAFAAIGHYKMDITGQVFAMFIIAIATSEMAVGLAILILWYKKNGSIEISSLKNMKDCK